MTWILDFCIFFVASLATLPTRSEGGDGLLGESPLRYHQRRSVNEFSHNGREARSEEYDCALQFKRYIPSSYEQEWYNNVKEWETNLEEVKLDVDHD